MCPELAEYTRGIQSSLLNLNYRDGLRVTPSRRPWLLFALDIDDHNDLHARATIHWPYSSQTSCTRTHRPRERRSSRASADLHGVCASSRRGEPDDIAYPRCAPSRGPRGGAAHVFRKVPQVTNRSIGRAPRIPGSDPCDEEFRRAHGGPAWAIGGL